MSKRHDQQDASGVLLTDGSLVILAVSNKTSPRYNTTTGVPQNGVAGYRTSALVVNPYGSAGSLLYTNSGTSTSTTWLNIA